MSYVVSRTWIFRLLLQDFALSSHVTSFYLSIFFSLTPLLSFIFIQVTKILFSICAERHQKLLQNLKTTAYHFPELKMEKFTNVLLVAKAQILEKVTVFYFYLRLEVCICCILLILLPFFHVPICNLQVGRPIGVHVQLIEQGMLCYIHFMVKQ